MFVDLFAAIITMQLELAIQQISRLIIDSSIYQCMIERQRIKETKTEQNQFKIQINSKIGWE